MVFVFGKSGYIGSKLSFFLESNSIDFLSVGRDDSSDILIDLSSESFTFKSKPFSSGDVFIFLAAVSSPEFCSTNKSEAYRINVENTQLLISALIEMGVFVLFASSDVVFGGGDKVYSESSNKNPTFEYAMMKSLIEDKFSLSDYFKVMRLSYVWSPTDKFTNYALSCSANSSTLDVYDPFVRSVIYIDDVIDFVNVFISDPNSIPTFTNLAGPEFLSRVSLADSLSEFITLNFKVVSPEPSFFTFRPPKILMISDCLTSILGRQVTTIHSAISAEFS